TAGGRRARGPAATSTRRPGPGASPGRGAGSPALAAVLDSSTRPERRSPPLRAGQGAQLRSQVRGDLGVDIDAGLGVLLPPERAALPDALDDRAAAVVRERQPDRHP